YAYVGNDPVNNTDSTGLWGDEVWDWGWGSFGDRHCAPWPSNFCNYWNDFADGSGGGGGGVSAACQNQISVGPSGGSFSWGSNCKGWNVGVGGFGGISNSVGPALLTSANAKKNQDDRFGDKVRDKAIDTIIKNVAGQAGRIFLRGKSWIDNGLTAYATYLDYMRLTACELYAGFKARAMSI